MTNNTEQAARALSHKEALEAIIGCSATTTVLSYQEAIEGYLKLRGLAHTTLPPADAGLVALLREVADAANDMIAALNEQVMTPKRYNKAGQRLQAARDRIDTALSGQEGAGDLCADIAQNPEPAADGLVEALWLVNVVEGNIRAAHPFQADRLMKVWRILTALRDNGHG